MKVIKHTEQELVLRENILMTRLLGLFFVLISTAGGIVISLDYRESYQPAVVLCIIFFVIGCFVLFFLTARLGYHIDKRADRVQINYPVRFGTRIETREFKLSELKSIQIKAAIGASSSDGAKRGPQRMQGFDFELNSGELVYCGISSTSAKEINEIIEKILEYKKVPVVESGKKEILWG